MGFKGSKYEKQVLKSAEFVISDHCLVYPIKSKVDKVEIQPLYQADREGALKVGTYRVPYLILLFF